MGPDIRNADPIEVGDVVTVRYMEALTLMKATAPRGSAGLDLEEGARRLSRLGACE